jgi:hypothetical protein
VAPQLRSMRNLYSMTKNQAAIRDLFKITGSCGDTHEPGDQIALRHRAVAPPARVSGAHHPLQRMRGFALAPFGPIMDEWSNLIRRRAGAETGRGPKLIKSS